MGLSKKHKTDKLLQTVLRAEAKDKLKSLCALNRVSHGDLLSEIINALPHSELKEGEAVVLLPLQLDKYKKKLSLSAKIRAERAEAKRLEAEARAREEDTEDSGFDFSDENVEILDEEGGI